ncbi:MAG: phage major capsid protein [Burkholderiales bacterium]
MLSSQEILDPHRHVPHDVRASIASSLAKYYSELSGLDDPKNRSFSLSRFLSAQAERLPLTGREREICGAAATMCGQEFNPFRCWIPFSAIRAMGTAPGAKGGYLADGQVLDAADALRAWSVVASAGVQILSNLRGNVVIPRVSTAVTASWIGENATAPAETPPTLGAASLTPKTAIALVKFSIQLLRQGESVETFLRAQLLAAAGELLDVAFLAGAGGVQPLGLLGTPGIGTQSGTSLAHAGLLTMRQKCLTAGAREENLQWAGAPAVQELLGARERASGGGKFLWDDNGILGLPARATKNAPASALVAGDFSQSVVGLFGPGLRLEIDPSQDLNSAGLVARVLLLTDVSFPQPSAFTVATSIT